MTEKFNPFLKENRIEGQETNYVTILDAKTETYEGTFISNRVLLTWLEDGKDKEWGEDFGIGQLVPTADGKSFRQKNGEAGRLGNSSGFAILYDLLEEGGFPVEKLYDDETGFPDVTALIGARLKIYNIQKKDKAGTLKTRTYTDKEGTVHEVKDFKRYLKEYEGHVKDAGNGSVPVDEEFLGNARTVVEDLIVEAGGTMTKQQIIAGLNKANADRQITTLLMKKSFSEGAAWTVDGATYSI